MSTFLSTRSAVPAELNALSSRVIGACIEVHRAMGPGLLESVYEACLESELRHQGVSYIRQAAVELQYRDVVLQAGLRLDFLIEDLLVLELKAVETILPVHRAQLLSYLRLTRRPLGLLVNFNVVRLREGVHRILNPAHPMVRTTNSKGGTEGSVDSLS
jgi:GxxExxY protein